MRNDKLNVYKFNANGSNERDDFGNIIKAKPSFLKTAKGSFQPYSRELLIKNYGYDVYCTKVFYSSDPIFNEYNENGKNNEFELLLEYNSVFYRVTKNIVWKKHKEVFSEEWVLP